MKTPYFGIFRLTLGPSYALTFFINFVRPGRKVFNPFSLRHLIERLIQMDYSLNKWIHRSILLNNCHPPN